MAKPDQVLFTVVLGLALTATARGNELADPGFEQSAVDKPAAWRAHGTRARSRA